MSPPHRLDTVSPPPYMNGGVEFLSWVIEAVVWAIVLAGIIGVSAASR